MYYIENETWKSACWAFVETTALFQSASVGASPPPLLVLARFTGLFPSTSLLPSRSKTTGIVAQAVLSKQIPTQSKLPQAKLSLSSAGHQYLPALIKHIDFHQRKPFAFVKILGSQAARKPVCLAELGQNGLWHVTQADCKPVVISHVGGSSMNHRILRYSELVGNGLTAWYRTGRETMGRQRHIIKSVRKTLGKIASPAVGDEKYAQARFSAKRANGLAKPTNGLASRNAGLGLGATPKSKPKPEKARLHGRKPVLQAENVTLVATSRSIHAFTVHAKLSNIKLKSTCDAKPKRGTATCKLGSRTTNYYPVAQFDAVQTAILILVTLASEGQKCCPPPTPAFFDSAPSQSFILGPS
ncbi:hypothetical protein B0H11DRAFT_1923612 [Mycena galericulata]|nr:hypothetical protein B0H11DRAFT_1923612 [Mycena galericulata]